MACCCDVNEKLWSSFAILSKRFLMIFFRSLSKIDSQPIWHFTTFIVCPNHVQIVLTVNKWYDYRWFFFLSNIAILWTWTLFKETIWAKRMTINLLGWKIEKFECSVCVCLSSMKRSLDFKKGKLIKVVFLSQLLLSSTSRTTSNNNLLQATSNIQYTTTSLNSPT